MFFDGREVGTGRVGPLFAGAAKNGPLRFADGIVADGTRIDFAFRRAGVRMDVAAA